MLVRVKLHAYVRAELLHQTQRQPGVYEKRDLCEQVRRRKYPGELRESA